MLNVWLRRFIHSPDRGGLKHWLCQRHFQEIAVSGQRTGPEHPAHVIVLLRLGGRPSRSDDYDRHRALEALERPHRKCAARPRASKADVQNVAAADSGELVAADAVRKL
jgi:hypothetical protein